MPKMKQRKYLRLDDMTEGMRVEVYGRYTSDWQVGTVIKVEKYNNQLMIDGKPVMGASKATEVTIAYDRGGEIKIFDANKDSYNIVRA